MIGVCSFLIYERQITIKEINEGEVDSELIYEDHKEIEKEKKSKKFKYVKRTLNILLDGLIVLLAFMFIIGIVDKAVNVSPLPIKSVVVATGSMSTKNEDNEYLFENNLDNQIQVNDLIFLEKVDSLDEIKLYDIICYLNEEDLQIVHRVVEVNDDYVITRGDANNVNDSIEITLDRIVGKYNGGRIPGVGAITFFLSSNYGITTIATILVISLCYTFTKDSITKAENKRLKTLKEIIKEENTYKVVSSSGTLEVKNGHYTYIENDEDNEIPSSLYINESETKLPKENKVKWRKS